MMPDSNSFVIEDYSLGQMPSVSLTDTTYTGVRGTEVLAGGISDFSGFSTLNALPGAAMEVETIGLQLWPDELLIDENMTRANLIRVYEEAPHGIVHLATHADFVDDDISESYIQLYGERLHLDEIRDMGWSDDPSVRLLVLSACNTATGSIEAELGFGGIAVQAGVQSVLASLWKVNDAGTLALMTAFYEQLGRSGVMTKAEALRRAQEELFNERIWFQGGHLQGTEATIILSEEMADLDNLYPYHPYFWSGFTMLGSPW
jgi:CHAT domain-containing protein